MAWKPVSSNAMDIKKQKGVPVIGTYAGFKMIQTKIGEQIIYNFYDEDEQPFGIYGFTTLRRAMEAVKEGALCRITYTGTQNMKTKFGMKDVHQVTVEVNEDEEAANGNGHDKAKVFADGSPVPDEE